MADSSKRGARFGNLNAARSIVPALKRLAKGKPLPENLQRVAEMAEIEAADLAADKGGLTNMTAGERAMLGIWKSAKAAELLVLFELVERGAIKVEPDGKTWDLQPGYQRLVKILSEQRAALVQLGLERRAKQVPTLAEYLKAKEAESENA